MADRLTIREGKPAHWAKTRQTSGASLNEPSTSSDADQRVWKCDNQSFRCDQGETSTPLALPIRRLAIYCPLSDPVIDLLARQAQLT